MVAKQEDILMRSLLGKVIRGERTKLNLSQEELSYRAKLDRSYITDIERGTRNISLESIRKLSDALGLSLVDLLAKVEGDKNKKLKFTLPDPVEILFVEDAPRDVELTLNALSENHIANKIPHCPRRAPKHWILFFVPVCTRRDRTSAAERYPSGLEITESGWPRSVAPHPRRRKNKRHSCDCAYELAIRR